MIIIYGLGNNEDKYLYTRHNAGRLVMEYITNKTSLTLDKGENWFFTKIKWNKTDVIFLHSSGYMNNSGSVLSKFIKYYKIDATDPGFRLLILQDDSDQISGNNKLALGGGHAGHNGIQDIYRNSLSCNITLDKVWRLKIGIRPLENIGKSETFVLQKFAESELTNLEKLANTLVNMKEDLADLNFEKVQNIVNTKI